MPYCEPDSHQSIALKADNLVAWLQAEWIARYPDEDLLTVWVREECIHAQALNRIDREMNLGDGYRFASYAPMDCPVTTKSEQLDHKGDITFQTGGFVFEFTHEPSGKRLNVPIVATPYADNGWYYVVMAVVPRSFTSAFAKFNSECERLAYAQDPSSRVVVIGGRKQTFEPEVNWDDIILPEKLKSDIFNDVQSFFAKGAGVYTQLGLKPFRKLLLAGVPGTGKTMICTALAKWALEQKYLVVYVSSAHKKQGDEYGSTFDKIDHALSVASSSELPTLIVLEELDAYLHDNEKAIILNVLDGNEASVNDKGTLLIATTNYPEAIDDRVLKRPGRLDRVFVVPETKREEDAEKMLRQYLGKMWQDDHVVMVPDLVGYPGAFIREVAVQALTQVAYRDLDELPVSILRESFDGLREQIDARDDMLKQRGKVGFINGTSQ
jgi:hypothetical protein